MNFVMERLNTVFSFSNSVWFYRLFALSTAFNPVACFIQGYKSWSAQSTEGLALTTFLILFTLQFIGTFFGIRIKEPALFLSMFFSAIGTAVTITAILVR